MSYHILRENIEHYRSLLETMTDEVEREHILDLLAEEEAKEAAVEHSPDKGANSFASPSC